VDILFDHRIAKIALAWAMLISYNDDLDDVPVSTRQLIPTISPVRLDLMVKKQNQLNLIASI
jgi:hypothetical protein